MKLTLSITNRSEVPRPVYVEPEGADYCMFPEQVFELRAEVAHDTDRFELWDNGDSIQVWPSAGMGFIAVFSESQELACGYQRPSTKLAD